MSVLPALSMQCSESDVLEHCLSPRDMLWLCSLIVLHLLLEYSNYRKVIPSVEKPGEEVWEDRITYVGRRKAEKKECVLWPRH